ncbi:MAG: glutaredoxin family protein [Microbacteriaceae bacterium]
MLRTGTVELTLIGKPGCHLCDDARDVLTHVIDGINQSGERSVLLTERSILDDARLRQEYLEDIPVVLIGGKVHTFWRVDPIRLRTAILEGK